jgi:hypothetical protein
MARHNGQAGAPTGIGLSNIATALIHALCCSQPFWKASHMADISHSQVVCVNRVETQPCESFESLVDSGSSQLIDSATSGVADCAALTRFEH